MKAQKTDRPKYKIEKFHSRYGWTQFDYTKVNQDDALRVAEITAKSRKAFFRVVFQGQTIAEYDYMEKKTLKAGKKK